MEEKAYILSEIKTLIGILNTWGNIFVPNVEGKEARAYDRLVYFCDKAQREYGMTIEEIGEAIA